MPTILTASQGGANIDDGHYAATLLSITVEQPTANSPSQKEWLKLRFVVDDGSAEGTELTAATGYKFTALSKTRAWIEALYGRKIENGEQVDLDTIPPRDCFVIVAKDDKGFARITNVLPVPKKSTGRPAIKPAPPVEPDEGEDGVVI
jgi:hypothetical protein